MLTIFTEKAQLLSKRPSELITITHSFLNELAVFHHPQNKLIPAQSIKKLLNIFESSQLTSSNIDAAYQLLASNSLSVLLRANFGQLSQNKLYGALLLQCTVILQNLSKQLKRRDLVQNFTYLKYAARGIILSKIINKLLQRTHAFMPQFYRFARTVIQIIQRLLTNSQLLNSDENISGQAELQHIVLRMCFSKTFNLKNIVSLLKYTNQQIIQLSGICLPAAQLQIVTTIKTNYQQIANSLPSKFKHMLLEVDQTQKQNKNDNVFLEQTIEVRELTPRFYDQQKSFEINKLRQKKLKLKKKIENDLRKDVLVRQQEAQILQQVRKEKIQRQHKKQLFVIEKQTAEARKFQRSMQKVKKIKKDDKGKGGDRSKSGGKKNFGIKGRQQAEKNKAKMMNKHKIGSRK